MYKIKLFIKYIIMIFLYPKRKRKIVDLYNDEDTIKMINKGYSIGRYGDGEISLIIGKDIGFQKKNDKLTERLQNIIEKYNSNKTSKFILGVPKAFNNCNGFLFEIKTYWLWYSFRNKKLIEVLSIKRDRNFSTQRYFIYCI